MKGEPQQQQHHHHHHHHHHLEDVKHTTTHTPMFSLHPHPFHHHHHHQLVQRECPTSEEEESRSSGGGGDGLGGTSAEDRSITKKIKTTHHHHHGGGDGASIEVAKRPRGRPPGSKNKPKPPVIITRESETAMRPYVLEIPTGLDIIDLVTRFARQRNIGLCILTASGSVANVSLRQPSTTPGSTVTFHGRFDILSISATHMPPSLTASAPSNVFTISLAGPQGQIFGGSVVGGLVAATTVFVVATSFTNPSFHRLPNEEDECPTSESTPQTPLTATPPPSRGAGSDSHLVQPVSMYSCHLPSDVIWAPSARPPPPPPPF